MELFGISPQELIVIAVVAVIVFGQRLPQVAGEAAATVQKIKRALNDLRRESGIDNEIRNARREIEQNVVRPVREADLSGTVQREVRAARSELQNAATDVPAATGAPLAAAASSGVEAPSDAAELPPTTPPGPQAPRDPSPS